METLSFPQQVSLPLQISGEAAGKEPSLHWALLLLHIPDILQRFYSQYIRVRTSSQPKVLKSKEIRLWKPAAVIQD